VAVKKKSHLFLLQAGLVNSKASLQVSFQRENRRRCRHAVTSDFIPDLQLAKQEAAQWRCLRGEEEEGDDELLRGPQDEWMTRSGQR